MYQDNKYPVRDPNKADNWRGRVRVDNVVGHLSEVNSKNVAVHHKVVVKSALGHFLVFYQF